MKKLLGLAIVLFTLALSAQQNIGYKATIKDGSGGVLTNQSVTIQFRILEGVAQTNVYEETHTTITDSNGNVILPIGAGTTSGTFSNIKWNEFEHSLNVQVDTGSGLIDLGTTAFNTVPYAIAAGNVSGLERIEEGSGIGWRLIGKDPNNYGDLGINALDLSNADQASTTYGATGNNSVALGYLSTSSGFGSMTYGALTEAESFFSTALGVQNIGGGSPIAWEPTDPLFEIGNGISEPSNALTILKNGKIGIGEHQPSGFLEVKASNSPSQPNINLVHEGATGARINFSNTATTNGNVWTFYGETDDTDANSVFNIFHSNAGNIIRVRGDARVSINGDLTTTGTTKIGSAGTGISEVVKITGIGDASGTTFIDYPAGFNWENTHVVSCKVLSNTGGAQGANWYTIAGNFNTGDDNSIYINLQNSVSNTSLNKIRLEASDSQYIATEFQLVLMRIE